MREKALIGRQKLRPAAQYVRMSTERQQYSIDNQMATIALYATNHRMRIVRSFTDAGKSGLTIRGRSGLKELIRNVELGNPDFEVILVYDISRWGRFQDTDESAHYEFVCKKAGIEVRYCAEPFDNDNSPTATLIKALKRTMAGEYSRELSIKVSAGQCRLAGMGFHMGVAPYGLTRFLVDENGRRKQMMRPGERKYVRTDHTILTPGISEEIKNVRRIFDLFAGQKKSVASIASRFNEEGITFRGHTWHVSAIQYILRNPVYMGTGVFQRYRSVLGGPKIMNPKENWIVREAAFSPIVSPRQFLNAQKIIEGRRSRFTNKAMLDALRHLWKRKGTLNSDVIDGAKEVPSTHAYSNHFGSLSQAYRLIGFVAKTGCSRTGQSLTTLRAAVSRDLASQIQSAGGLWEPRGYLSVQINSGVTIRIVFSRPYKRKDGRIGWRLNLKHKRTIDLLIAIRLNADCSVLDYYVVPNIAQLHGTFYLVAKNNAAFLDLYRMDSLKPLVNALGRIHFSDAL